MYAAVGGSDTPMASPHLRAAHCTPRTACGCASPSVVVPRGSPSLHVGPLSPTPSHAYRHAIT
eukprot:13313022-Alexandrium_andersonii.AAC.1